MYSDFESTSIFRIFLCDFCLFFFSWFTDNPVEAGLKPSDETLPENIENHEKTTKEPIACPHHHSSFISKATFSWVIELFRTAAKRELKLEDIYEVRDDVKIGPNIKKFSVQFEEELDRIEKYNQRNPGKKKRFAVSNSLRLIWRNQGFNIVCLFLLKTCADFVIFSQPLLLSFMIDFIKDKQSIKWQGILIVIGFILASTLKTVFNNVQTINAFAVTLNLRSAFQNIIFNKALRLSNQARNKRTTGQITNLFTTDPTKFTSYASIYIYILSAPLQLVLGFSILFYEVGKAAYAGILIIAIIMVVQYLLNFYQHKYVTIEAKENDIRVNEVNQALYGIKIIKLYGW